MDPRDISPCTLSAWLQAPNKVAATRTEFGNILRTCAFFSERVTRRAAALVAPACGPSPSRSRACCRAASAVRRTSST